MSTHPPASGDKPLAGPPQEQAGNGPKRSLGGLLREYRREMVTAVLAVVTGVLLLLVSPLLKAVSSLFAREDAGVDISPSFENLLVGDTLRITVAIQSRDSAPVRGRVRVDLPDSLFTGTVRERNVRGDSILEFSFLATRPAHWAFVIASYRRWADTAVVHISSELSNRQPSRSDFSGEWILTYYPSEAVGGSRRVTGRMSLMEDNGKVVGHWRLEGQPREGPEPAMELVGWKDGDLFEAALVTKDRLQPRWTLQGHWCRNQTHFVIYGPVRWEKLDGTEWVSGDSIGWVRAYTLAREGETANNCPSDATR